MLEVDPAASNLAGPKIETVYRIAEEALRNVGMHADASHVNVRVAFDQVDPANHVLILTVEDDGKGFDPRAQSPGHFGLLGMQEQADILGGKFDIRSTPDRGTCVRIEVSI
ncbi:MAG: ATP-binding protein [Aestuariivirga sp.]